MGHLHFVLIMCGQAFGVFLTFETSYVWLNNSCSLHQAILLHSNGVWLLDNQVFGSQSMVSGPASPENLLEVQILKPHPRPPESETLGLWLGSLWFNQSTRAWFWLSVIQACSSLKTSGLKKKKKKNWAKIYNIQGWNVTDFLYKHFSKKSRISVRLLNINSRICEGPDKLEEIQNDGHPQISTYIESIHNTKGFASIAEHFLKHYIVC